MLMIRKIAAMNHPRPHDREQVIHWAQELMTQHFYILDTETTGLGAEDEIVQIAIVDKMGQCVLETLLRPRRPIPARVIAVHGISNERVVDAPTLRDIYIRLSALLAGATVVAYNADFDQRMVEQTCRAYGFPLVRPARWLCVMKAYARYYGQTRPRSRGYVWQSLSKACAQQQIQVQGAHTALGDVLMTLALLKKMASGDEN